MATLKMLSGFKSRNRFSEYPATGAMIYFGSGGGHMGIVERYDATYAYTIEGNTSDSGSAEGDGVYRKRRVRRDAYVYGYPAYAEGIDSADPAWATSKPASPEPTKPPANPAPARPWVWASVGQDDSRTTPAASRSSRTPSRRSSPPPYGRTSTARTGDRVP
ncbi:hypothetical protein [Streptomyces yunnanensis]|uniref:hypothetical protein n=1 Tax=Streptomyces yunnanensis TaxID=156453 RepID=UPI001160E8B6|nr:hypothetical protein [Streptomyces yunnanensis]